MCPATRDRDENCPKALNRACQHIDRRFEYCA